MRLCLRPVDAKRRKAGLFVSQPDGPQPIALRHPCSGTRALHLSHALDHACDADDMPRGYKTLTRLAVSRWDRLLIFGACNLAALACFFVCFTFTLFPLFNPRKFVTL